MQHGRPSRSAQLDIQNDLRKYYDLGLSARVAAQKTHINVKTATEIIITGFMTTMILVEDITKWCFLEEVIIEKIFPYTLPEIC